MTPGQSVAKWLNKEVSYPTGQYAGQCLSWVKQFIQDTQGIQAPASGNGEASGYWLNRPAPLPSYYEFITNEPSNVSQMPSQYDIMCFNAVPVIGGGMASHISVYNQGNMGASTFTSWDQNWGNNLTVHLVTHVWTGQGTIMGWLHANRAISLGTAADTQQTAPTQATGTYTIKAGDTFWALEDELKLNHGTLERLNPTVNPNDMRIGTVIKI